MEHDKERREGGTKRAREGDVWRLQGTQEDLRMLEVATDGSGCKPKSKTKKGEKDGVRSSLPNSKINAFVVSNHAGK